MFMALEDAKECLRCGHSHRSDASYGEGTQGLVLAYHHKLFCLVAPGLRLSPQMTAQRATEFLSWDCVLYSWAALSSCRGEDRSCGRAWEAACVRYQAQWHCGLNMLSNGLSCSYTRRSWGNSCPAEKWHARHALLVRELRRHRIGLSAYRIRSPWRSV